MRALSPRFLLLASLALAVACNTPPKDPPRDGADGPIAPVRPATTASGTASAATPTPPATASAAPVASGRPSGCSSDADCRTFSSYCAEAPCACRVLTKNEGDPRCLGSGVRVSCFVDPCMKKAAHCQSGACVLTAGGPAGGATEK